MTGKWDVGKGGGVDAKMEGRLITIELAKRTKRVNY